MDDRARALTKRGHKQAKRMAAWLRPRLGGSWRIVSSPAKRAIETVAPLDRRYEVRERLDPSCGPRDILAESGWPDGEDDVIVVGHQPTLGQVAARLLGGAGDVSIRKGAIWWFAARKGETVLRAVLDPDLLGD